MNVKLKCMACNRNFKGERGLAVHNRRMHPIVPEDRQLPAPEPPPKTLEEVVRTMTSTELQGFITSHTNDLGSNLIGLLHFHLILMEEARYAKDRLVEMLNDPSLTV